MCHLGKLKSTRKIYKLTHKTEQRKEKLVQTKRKIYMNINIYELINNFDNFFFAVFHTHLNEKNGKYLVINKKKNMYKYKIYQNL